MNDRSRNLDKKVFVTGHLIPIFVSLMLIVPSTGFSELSPAVISIPEIKAGAEIDGDLDEKFWADCLELTDFVVWTLDAYTGDPVTILLGYDAQNIYIGFRNSDPDAVALTTSIPDKRLHDTFLWGRHFSRVVLNNGTKSIALMGDPKGTMADWADGDMAWNGNWKYAAGIGNDHWIGEFQIPFNDFGLTGPPVGESWSLTLSRSFPSGESAEWTGICNFSRAFNTTLHFGKWPSPVPGKNELGFKAVNSGENRVEVTCHIELIPFAGEPRFINQSGQGSSSDMELLLTEQPLRYRYSFGIDPGEFQQELVFDLPAEGNYYGTVSCSDPDGKILLRNRGFWFTLEPNAQMLREIGLKMGRADAGYSRISNPVIKKLELASDSLLNKLEGLRGNLSQAWQDNRWDDLTQKIKDLDIQVDQYVHEVRCSSLNDWQDIPDFGLTVSHAVSKIKMDRPFPGEFRQEVDVSAAKNEYESFQLVVLPFGKDIRELTIGIDHLQNNSGYRIPGENIVISKVGYNFIDWQADYVAEKGWHPDPLLPVNGPVAIPGHLLCQPFWITIYVPPGTPAGHYEGRISVTGNGGEEQSIRVNLKVRDFELPVESHLKTHSWDDLNYLAGFYNLEEYPLDWYLRFCELLLKNRMNPGSAGTNYISAEPDASGGYDFSRVEKILDFCLSRGLSRFSIIQMKKGPYEPEEAEKVYDFIGAYAEFLRDKGWMDKALIELWDEPTSLEWKGVKERAERIRRIDPGLRLQLFAEGGPYSFWEEQSREFGLIDLIDIWAPWRLVESPETQAAGGEIWTYFCTLARGIAPNFYIDRPAIYQRTIAWYCWMYGVDGFEHWSTDYFWRNVKEGQPMENKWPNKEWDSRTYHQYNGEGQLVYPGPDGWPLASIRLEVFRDSMEDYEYLYKLNELIEKNDGNRAIKDLDRFRKMLKVENHLLIKYPMEVQDTQENTIMYPDQPEKFLEYREAIADAIESLGE